MQEFPLGSRLEKFIDEYVPSLVAWNLITLFCENLSVRGSAADLTLFVGRKEGDLRTELENMNNKGILKKEKGTLSDIYFYDPSPELKEEIDFFISSLKSRETRYTIFLRVLRKS